jgi:putative membrane protein
MGGADAIPGVSGGTIALILGIYDLFIESLHQVVSAPIALFKPEQRPKVLAALRFLVPLGIGVAIAYFLATKLLVGKTESPGLMIRPDTAPACYAFFFGLVLLSIREPWRRIKNAGAGHYIAALLGCAAAAVFAGLPHASQEPATWMLFLGGAGAISVMIMPGVSGSLLLVILGQYQTIVSAVHDRNFGVVGVFFLGIGCGVLLFVPTLRLLLKRHHDLTMAALTGLMAGSLRALWPWKTSYDIKQAQMVNTGIGDHLPLVLAAAIAGAGVVYLLTRLERRLEKIA